MKQKIAINFDLIEEIYNRCIDEKLSMDLQKIGVLYEFQKNINQFHEILIDDLCWAEKCKNLEKILDEKSQTVSTFFKDYFYRRSELFIKEKISLEQKDKLIFVELAKKTPDKILISEEKISNEKEINYYNIEEFLSDNYKSDCVLLRENKILHLQPNCELESFNIFAPYLREAETIEFCDPYLLFNDKKYIEGETKFIKEVSDYAENLNHLIFRIDMSTEIKYRFFLEKFKELKKELLNHNQKLKIEIFNYNKSRHANHDRFIIVNHDEFTVTFTSSFNNFRKSEKGFLVNDAMKIIFRKGREYYD